MEMPGFLGGTRPRNGTVKVELFESRYRARTSGVIVGYFFAQACYTATHSWLLFHPQRELGIAPLFATAIVIVGGALGIAGNPLGAWLSDRVGRRPTTPQK